jgi:hypothetical protein
MDIIKDVEKSVFVLIDFFFYRDANEGGGILVRLKRHTQLGRPVVNPAVGLERHHKHYRVIE